MAIKYKGDIIMGVKERLRIEKAIEYCEKLIDQYDNNVNITDIDICWLIEILRR